MGEQAEFTIGDQVSIKGHGIQGVVRAIWTDHHGTQYQVQYTDKLENLQRDWVLPSEITHNVHANAPEMELEPLFKLGNRVKLRAFEVSGRVCGIHVTDTGAEFQVMYRDDHGRIQRETLAALELELEE